MLKLVRNDQTRVPCSDCNDSDFARSERKLLTQRNGKFTIVREAIGVSCFDTFDCCLDVAIGM